MPHAGVPSEPAPSPQLARAVASVVSRRALCAGVEAFGRHGRVALLASGVAVLAARSLVPGVAHAWIACPAALLGAALSALRVALLARPVGRSATAWLDVQGGASGAVVTEAELGRSAWSPLAAARLEQALERLPRVAWTASLRSLGLPLAFVLAVLWVPLPSPPAGPTPFAPERALERLEEKLTALEATLELEPELAADLRERLERIQESAAQDRPDAAFEALDRLEQRLDAQAERALDAAQRAADRLAQAAGDPHLDHAQEALGAALEELRDGGLTRGLPATLGEALHRNAGATPEGLQLSSAELAKLAREMTGALSSRFATLDAARMIDPSRLRALARALELREAGESGDFDPDHECDESCKAPGGT